MTFLSHRSRLAVACLAVLTALVALSAARAKTAMAHMPCTERFIEHPFAAWDDNADYFLIKQGSLGSGANYAWRFAGAELNARNNPFSPYSYEESSLSLGAGASATSPRVCVTVDDPTMRFFVRNSGAETGTLKVDAVYRDE